MVHEVSASSNYLAQNEITAHFGLGNAASIIDLVRIEWPSGRTSELYDVQPNQTLTVLEPIPAPPAATGIVLLLGLLGPDRRIRRLDHVRQPPESNGWPDAQSIDMHILKNNIRYVARKC